ncbi:hypothetical protein EDC94DRAFT_642315 [Helicostylum pulchrum]|nr:hypothetical protein EDC94DRAFT_642315 [Helicostylum pulchrum]
MVINKVVKPKKRLSHLTEDLKKKEICESYGFKSFRRFSLRNTLIPSYIAINTMILNNQILEGSQRSRFDKLSIWGKYIENIPNEELLATKGKTVLIDPGRRDLLYCMHEDSSYSYTRNQKVKELKSTKFRKLHQRFKPTNIQECEAKLSQYSSPTVNADTYIKY